MGRFAINTTVGVVGFFDYAARLGLEPHAEDFGQTLGWWGVPPGPYLVWPILGPSNPRDTVGLIGDSAVSIAPWWIDWYILTGARVFETVNTRAMFLETVAEAKRASFDYYSFVRNAYFQRRQALINDRPPRARSTKRVSTIRRSCRAGGSVSSRIRRAASAAREGVTS